MGGPRQQGHAGPAGTSCTASVALVALVLAAVAIVRSQPLVPLRFAFTDIAASAGLTARTVYGGEGANRYLLETTGSGVAALRLRRRRLARHLPGQRLDAGGLSRWARRRPATCIATGATAPSRTSPRRPGLAPAGWGQGACAGDYDNDGDERPVRHLLGPEPADRNRGDGTFEDVDRRRPGSSTRAAALGHGLRLPRLRPRRPARSLRRQLHRLRPRDRAGRPSRACAATRACPVACGPPGLTGGKNVLYRNIGDGTFDDVSDRVGHHDGQRHLRPRRQHARLRRRRLGRSLRRQRLEPERALSQQPRRHVHRHRRPGRLRLQPGRQAAGGHGRRRRRLRSQRHARHLQDQLRRRHLDALRQHAARASATTGRSPPASASTRAGSGGASASSISTTTAGSTCSSSTATSIPEVDQVKTEAGYRQREGGLSQSRRRPLRRRHRAARPAGDDAARRPRRGVRGLRQRRRRRCRRQQRARRARAVSARPRRGRHAG